MGAEHEAVGFRSDTNRDVLVRLSFPSANDVEALIVEIEAAGLALRHRVVTMQRGDRLDDFLANLAADWQGWEGVRHWATIEGDLSIDATHDGSIVELLFRVQRDSDPDAWHVHVPIRVEPGESLSRLAIETAALFSPE